MSSSCFFFCDLIQKIIESIRHLAQNVEKVSGVLTNRRRKAIITAKIEARGSSVSSSLEAAFAGVEREHRRSEEKQLRLSLLGRRKTSAGLSRKWSAIEYKQSGRGPGRETDFVP